MKHVSLTRALFVSAFISTAVVSCGSNAAEDTSSTVVESTAVDTSVGDIDGSGSTERIVSLSPTHTEILLQSVLESRSSQSMRCRIIRLKHRQ